MSGRFAVWWIGRVIFFTSMLFWSAFLAWALAVAFDFISQPSASLNRIDYFLGKIARGPRGEELFILWICWFFYAIPALLSFTKSKFIEKYGAIFLIITLSIAMFVFSYQSPVWIFLHYSEIDRNYLLLNRTINILQLSLAVFLPYILAWKLTNMIFGRLMPAADVRSASDT